MGKGKSPSDKELIKKIQDGNTEAFHQLHERYKKRVLNYIYKKFGGNYSFAEEVTQEAFIKIYENIEKYKPTGSVCGWIYTIAGNIGKNKLRKIDREGEISLQTQLASEDESFTLEDTIKDKEPGAGKKAADKGFSRIVHRCIGELDEKYKEVLILCGIQDLSYKEAAEITGCTTQTIGVRLMRAREKLKKLVEEQNEM